MFNVAAARMSKPFMIGLLAATAGCAIVGVLAWLEIERERRIDWDDLGRRAHALAHQMDPQVREALALPDSQIAAALQPVLTGHRRLLGFAVYRPNGRQVAIGPSLTTFAAQLDEPVATAIMDRCETMEVLSADDGLTHILATPIQDADGTVEGILVTAHDMSHLEDRTNLRRWQFTFCILFVTPLVTGLVFGAVRSAYEQPLQRLADWMRRLRVYDAPDSPPAGIPVELLSSESQRLAASFRAARAARWSESRALVRADNFWTRDRLRTHSINCLRNRQLIVVSNREPYMHQFRDGRPRLIVPAGGLVTALDPILQSCGGVWVAHGSGEADRETANAEGRLSVPPDDPQYMLRRVWLSKDEEQGYYYGFANEGLWPLCHLAHERPTFRAADWDHYVRANQRFANAVLEESLADQSVVLVQDYQLALVPQMLKAARPDLIVGIFWHIPWPNPEAFRICPRGAEILRGMLGADLIGFHLQQYCNNFLDTVDRMVEARLDWDHFSVELKGHATMIRPFPISVESWSERGVPQGDELAAQIAQLKERHSLEGVRIAVGVDRIDYTKGLPERFRAIARFLEKYPQHRERFTFVQLGAPSRTHIPRYRSLVGELETLADEINWKFQTERWKPIRFLAAHHDASTVHAFLTMADLCVVSSLHDGMNLVAKEYVAAKAPGAGMLVLSEFAGAARELSDAMIVNPYDTEQFADAIRYAVEMSDDERHDRMQRMQSTVEENNVYRWAGNLLAELMAARTRQTPRRRDAGHPLSDPHLESFSLSPAART
jgi:trehalose 6-phosphate synthase